MNAQGITFECALGDLSPPVAVKLLAQMAKICGEAAPSLRAAIVAQALCRIDNLGDDDADALRDAAAFVASEADALACAGDAAGCQAQTLRAAALCRRHRRATARCRIRWPASGTTGGHAYCVDSGSPGP